MEKRQMNEMELYDEKLLNYHRINLVFMLSGLLWTAIAIMILKKPIFGFFGSFSFVFPATYCLVSFSDYRIYGNEASTFSKIIYAGSFLIPLIFLLGILSAVIWEKPVLAYPGTAIFLTFLLFSIIRGIKLPRKLLIDERTRALSVRSLMISLGVVFGLIVVLVSSTGFLKSSAISLKDISLIWLNISYIFWGTPSAYFLFFYKKI